MINAILVENNFERCKMLVYEMAKANIKIYKIISFKKDWEVNLENECFDILIIDTDKNDWKLDKIDQFVVLKKIVLVISNSNEVLNFVKKFNCDNLLYYNNTLESVGEIIQHWIKQLSYFDDIILNKIDKELEYLRFNFSHKGTLYLRESIFQIYIKRGIQFNLNKDIYLIVSQKYNTTVNNIKCDIYQACYNCYYDCEEERLEKYLNHSCIEKPTTVDIIRAILSKI